MTVLIKQTSSFQSIGKCGARVVCHGAQRHAVVCLDHTHLGECFLDGDGVDLAKEGIDERLAGNLDIAGALHVAVQIGAAHVVHELRLNVGPHADGARSAQAHERHGEGVLARVHAEVVGQQVGDLGRVGDVARGFLNTHDVGMCGQALYVALADAAAATAGDVVQDAGDVHGIGDGLKVLVDALFVGLVVVGGDEQQAVGSHAW